MTNTIAAFLAALILGFFAYDALAQDWSMSLYLGRRGLEFTEYLAFWR